MNQHRYHGFVPALDLPGFEPKFDGVKKGALLSTSNLADLYVILFKLMEKMLKGDDIRGDLERLAPRLASVQMEHAYIMETENGQKTMFMKYVTLRLEEMFTKMNEKMEESNKKMEESNKKLRNEMNENFKEMNEKLTEKIEASNKKLTEKIEESDKKLTEKIEESNEELRKEMKDDNEKLRKDMDENNEKLKDDMKQGFEKMEKEMNGHSEKIDKKFRGINETFQDVGNDVGELREKISTGIKGMNARLTDRSRDVDRKMAAAQHHREELDEKCIRLRNVLRLNNTCTTRLDLIGRIVHAKVYNLQYRYYNREQPTGDMELLLP